MLKTSAAAVDSKFGIWPMKQALNDPQHGLLYYEMKNEGNKIIHSI